MDLEEKMPVSKDFFSGHMNSKEEKLDKHFYCSKYTKGTPTEQDGALDIERQKELDVDI